MERERDPSKLTWLAHNHRGSLSVLRFSHTLCLKWGRREGKKQTNMGAEIGLREKWLKHSFIGQAENRKTFASRLFATL